MLVVPCPGMSKDGQPVRLEVRWSQSCQISHIVIIFQKWFHMKGMRLKENFLCLLKVNWKSTEKGQINRKKGIQNVSRCIYVPGSHTKHELREQTVDAEIFPSQQEIYMGPEGGRQIIQEGEGQSCTGTKIVLLSRESPPGNLLELPLKE